jgi:hypothetical protein
MTTIWQAPAVVVVFMWLNGPADTLDRAARREALRRSIMPQSIASLSIYDWPPATSLPATPTGVPSPPSPAPDIGVSPRGVAVEAAPPAGETGQRDEAWWRSRVTTASAALERDQTLADAMQSHVNALQTDVVNRDDPAQQAALRQRLAAALTELERLKAQIAADRQAILEIEDEARRLNVPAGWIRREEAIS